MLPKIAVGKVSSGAHVFVLGGVTLQGTSARQALSAYHAPSVNLDNTYPASEDFEQHLGQKHLQAITLKTFVF